ncbi:hypothetical protein J3458_019747 [Metarhizium acridum]|uniref:uncharacterized protein n=1 Tax=Metarhizium acridum TaxID=92637 RepID=UPI001C6C8E65|nr:hypothetical protein J3458_019747 [Metarhizium acridum]
MLPEEKIQNEVATIRYIQDHTAIPVPFILHWGTREESPLGIGPFIIMDYINHAMNMTAALNTPGLTSDIPPVPDPNIDEAKLEMLYRQVANILLQLSKLELPLIGALEETDEWSWEVTWRPLSMPMNELVRTGTFPRAKLPTSTFKTSLDYFQALARLHVDHLTHQRNDAIESRADCQRKYTARQLFQKLAGEKKLVSDDRYDKGPFKFWCDDPRPSNILLDAKLQIVAVIDWEFSYAAPREFTFAPPWWLLIEQPEYWVKGLEDWAEQYERRLTTFLKAVMDCEDASIASGQLQEEQRLSGKMRESWASGDFWTVYAARRNFAFDGVYWKKLDPRFFGDDGSSGPGDAWMKRLELLYEQTRVAMEAFADKKVAESETRNWPGSRTSSCTERADFFVCWRCLLADIIRESIIGMEVSW